MHSHACAAHSCMSSFKWLEGFIYSTAWLLLVVIHSTPTAQLHTIELTHISQLTLQQQCTPRVNGYKAHSRCGHQQLVKPYMLP